jgi:hypothetical protein
MVKLTRAICMPDIARTCARPELRRDSWVLRSIPVLSPTIRATATSPLSPGSANRILCAIELRIVLTSMRVLSDKDEGFPDLLFWGSPLKVILGFPIKKPLAPKPLNHELNEKSKLPGNAGPDIG